MGVGVDVEAAAAAEPHKGQVGLLGELDGQRRRRADGREDRYAALPRLLHQLERRPAADLQDGAGCLLYTSRCV